MEETTNIIKRKYKYAADYGLILGGYIAVFFILDYLFPGNVFVSILGTMGMACTPFVCFRLAKQYRDKAWGGYIRFGQIWSFGVWLFLFAALLMSVLYYVRFEFLQPNYIADAFNQVLIMAEQMKYSKEQMDALTSFGIPTTINMIFYYLWLYVIGGGLLFLLISPMVVRKKPENKLPDTDSDNSYEPYKNNDDSNESKA